MEEIWKAIPGHPGYEASTLGRIRSINRVITKNGRPVARKGVVLKNALGPGGYLLVSLNNQQSCRVHRMILITFVGTPPAGMQACHNDGNRANNRTDNLRWDTSKHNHADRIGHGTAPVGENNGRSKLSAAQVVCIRGDTRPRYVVAAEYGVTPSLISQIITRRIWSHV
jgi:hypothetical protein